jgi:hypothetical protein
MRKATPGQVPSQKPTAHHCWKAVERREHALFEDLQGRYAWVLSTIRYRDTADLVESLRAQSIEQAEQKAQEVALR